MTNTTHHDVIILGGGAAGLSAGLVLARAQARVLVLDSGEPRNAAAAEMHGFLSRDGMNPAELLAVGRGEVTASGGVVRAASVVAITGDAERGFSATLADGSVEHARALLVATGLSDEIPSIPGIREAWGSVVHHCPYCHGYEVRNQSILVLGGEAREMSIKQAALLRRYSNRVAFATNGIELTDAERNRIEAFGVRIVDGAVERLTDAGNAPDAVVLVLADGRTVAGDAVFIAPRMRPNDALLRSLGCAINEQTGFATVDENGQTSVAGVWAAGNAVNPRAQVITAAGAASAAAIAINGWLLEKDLDLASVAQHELSHHFN